MELAADQPADFRTLLLRGARCWREARDANHEVRPALFAMLRPLKYDMLAPVLSGLLRVYEAALGRKLRVGDATDLSEDEQLLVQLISGVQDRRACLHCNQGVGSALDGAICSARIMIATMGRRP
ncbi:hypothetical protein FHS91_003967 [Sphingobium xanthum]|uniref:hypothetical protein n=1 Tax=Sphingobium xanthum TaxID=1387165 RepID=UPI001C8C1A20|nr:hypothetical protein [Sphingobium xanthum]